MPTKVPVREKNHHKYVNPVTPVAPAAPAAQAGLTKDQIRLGELALNMQSGLLDAEGYRELAHLQGRVRRAA
ncbi:hypothetical protein COY20_03050 [Candidatus Shapirobacteria bacterium CG_4_10_14_0_2_um_filter_40_12]|uniref:Uncharacterized protein n=1 Tax=Candidatus Shapirobacteria bacterium CG_4_10_14_0_2_um_filter_40_12 TaxID=1974871 RepID=A0A2M7TSM7_9BACT|nr:MAG: hypothetical protein COY20_03050 [Candidatus Shapirobacteria bacterium CG_4_10_14_0_2_um_filter_40_12]